MRDCFFYPGAAGCTASFRLHYIVPFIFLLFGFLFHQLLQSVISSSTVLPFPSRISRVTQVWICAESSSLLKAFMAAFTAADWYQDIVAVGIVFYQIFTDSPAPVLQARFIRSDKLFLLPSENGGWIWGSSMWSGRHMSCLFYLKYTPYG